MNVVLWLAQVVFAAAMLGPGYVHAFRYDRAIERLPWVAAFGKQGMAIIGILEILGGVGLIVLAVSGILVWSAGIPLTLHIPLARACVMPNRPV